MINRSLIRIKTVQILYSYLLSRSDFKLTPAPDVNEASNDVKFAYSVYLDLIVLILKLSSVPPIDFGNNGLMLPPDSGIKKNRVARAVASVDAVRKILAKDPERICKFDSCLKDISNAIFETTLYKEYKRKRKLQMSDDVSFWLNVVNEVIRRNKSIERILRRDEIFSHIGFDMGIKMFENTLSGFDNTNSSCDKFFDDLNLSLRMAYDLYHAILLLPLAITEIHNERLEAAKNKYLPTEEDTNPNLRLSNNLYIKAIAECKKLQQYITDNPNADPTSWRDFEITAGRILDSIVSSELYAKYISSEDGDYATDAAFWRDALRYIVFPSDDLEELLETQNVYWNDDLAIMSTFALKTIKRSYSSQVGEDDEFNTESLFGALGLLPMYMNEEDSRFGSTLFNLVVNNRETYRSYIDRFINPSQWDTERLAFMDIVIMLTAIAEIINFPSIPIPVTMNEYIEIANDYSTSKSGQFINGILFSVVKYLNEEGIINKI